MVEVCGRICQEMYGTIGTSMFGFNGETGSMHLFEFYGRICLQIIYSYGCLRSMG